MASIFNVGTFILPVITATAIIIWWSNKKDSPKMTGFNLGALSSGIWGTLLPLGLILWGSLSLIGSTVNKEWRDDWATEWKIRSVICSSIFISLILAAGLPVPNPVGAQSWGEPLLTENPDASLWPANEQHLWTINSPELAVVTVSTTRIPGVLNPFGASQATAEMVQLLGADDTRMRQAIQRMSELTILRSIFNPNDFDLVLVPSEGHHRYYSSSVGIDVDLVAVRQHVTYDALIPNSEVLEVVTVYYADWGGVVNSLTVVRPIANSGDVWAENIVIEWLDNSFRAT